MTARIIAKACLGCRVALPKPKGKVWVRLYCSPRCSRRASDRRRKIGVRTAYQCVYCDDEIHFGRACEVCKPRMRADQMARWRARLSPERTRSIHSRQGQLECARIAPDERKRRLREYGRLSKWRRYHGITNSKKRWLDLEELLHFAEDGEREHSEERGVVGLWFSDYARVRGADVDTRVVGDTPPAVQRAWERLKLFAKGYGVFMGAFPGGFWAPAELLRKRAAYWLVRL